MSDFTTGIAFGALVGAIGAASVSIGSFLSRRAVSAYTNASNENDENHCSCGKKRRARDDDDEETFLSTPNKRTCFERELKRANAFYIPRSRSPRRRRPFQSTAATQQPAGGNASTPTSPIPPLGHFFIDDNGIDDASRDSLPPQDVDMEDTLVPPHAGSQQVNEDTTMGDSSATYSSGIRGRFVDEDYDSAISDSPSMAYSKGKQPQYSARHTQGLENLLASAPQRPMQTSPLESRSNVPSQPTTPQSVEPAEELRSRVSAAPVFVPRNKPAKYVLPPLRTKFPPQSPSVKANDPERPPLKGKSRAKPAPRTAVWRSALVVRAVGLFVAHAKAPNGWKTISGAHLLKAMIDFDDNMRIVAIPFNGHGATSFDATVDSLETTITDWAIYNEGQMFVVTLRERAGLMRYKFQIQNSDSAQQLVDAIAKRIVRKPGPPTLMTTPKNTPKSSTPKAASKLQLATRPSPPPLARTHSTFMLPPASIPAASSSQPVASTSQAPSDSLASPATSSVPLTPRMGFPPIPPIALMADEAPPSSQKRGLQTPAAKKASPLDVALPPTPERPDEEANTDADDEDSFSNTSDRGSPSPCGSP